MSRQVRSVPIRKYAMGTDVDVSRSRDELEKMLVKHGATRVAVDRQATHTTIVFEMRGRYVRLQMAIPKAEDFQQTEKGRQRSPAAMTAASADEHKRRWRALVLITKAKLEAVESGFTSFEREFLADVLLYNGKTMGEEFIPKLAESYTKGSMPEMPKLLGG